MKPLTPRWFHAGLVVLAAGASAGAQQPLLNWENHPVRALEVLPNGSRLLLANTSDDRLDVYALDGPTPARVDSVAVGINPVSVRVRSNTEAWVVNHISDSISIVDLTSMNVVRTLATADEPFDVVFAGTPPRAFVSCSQANVVQVFDLADLGAPPLVVPISGEDPRVLAASPDGQTVYVAIFESGNASTVLGGGLDDSFGVLNFPPNVVSDPLGPHGGQNPPPNSGMSFSPAIAPGNDPPPPVSLIVKRNGQGRWMDDNGGDWTDFVSGPQAALSGRVVGWTVPDNDIAVIDANTLAVSYVTGLMNMVMALAVNPATGAVTAVGTDATNEIRFEENLRGRFLRVNGAVYQPSSGAKTIVDLNPHLTYTTSNIPQTERNKSLGDPRRIVWNAAGTRGYISGMGSNNVIVVDENLQRVGLTDTIVVGEGPIGLALDELRGKLYVQNRFDASLSVVDLATEFETSRQPYFDPTPIEVKIGRKYFYSTQKFSGLGHASCASCHVDARTDHLAWDLGKPEGEFVDLSEQNLGANILGLAPPSAELPFEPFHPMKGPAVTQTMQDIINREPHHWRGDRDGIEEFNQAFVSLMGDDGLLSATDQQEFKDFLMKVWIPPNPYRLMNNTLPTAVPLNGHYATGRFTLPDGAPLPPGNAQNGMALFRDASRRLDGGRFACVTCHTLPTGLGTNTAWNDGLARFQPLPPGPLDERHHMLVSVTGVTNRTIKVPQLRNLYEKVGMDLTQPASRMGFGFLHDGSIDSLARFISQPNFDLADDQEVADLIAFLLAFSGSDLPTAGSTTLLVPPGTTSRDTHAAVGVQQTLMSFASAPPAQLALIDAMIALAQTNRVGLIVRGVWNGERRGFRYLPGGLLQADRSADAILESQLREQAAAGSELTYTLVPSGAQTRMGVDRDLDGFYDQDEIDACSDPTDPISFPGGSPVFLRGDCNCDGLVNNFDIDPFVAALIGGRAAYLGIGGAVECWERRRCWGDVNGDGAINNFDIDPFVALLQGP
ncbi:MAG: hypothetical protein AB7Q17_00490 [Phycisphaerae bacterium]